MITVQVWDRGQVKAVESAIRDSGLGLNPQSDGQLVRIPIPELSQERRTELTKIAHKYAEQARVAVHHTLNDKVQKLTDDHVKKVDDTLAQKEKEILQV
jgi:ribosome recycling factor